MGLVTAPCCELKNLQLEDEADDVRLLDILDVNAAPDPPGFPPLSQSTFTTRFKERCLEYWLVLVGQSGLILDL